jgi:hypothetical protein
MMKILAVFFLGLLAGSLWGSTEEAFSNGYTGPKFSLILSLVGVVVCHIWLLFFS